MKQKILLQKLSVFVYNKGIFRTNTDSGVLNSNEGFQF